MTTCSNPTRSTNLARTLACLALCLAGAIAPTLAGGTRSFSSEKCDPPKLPNTVAIGDETIGTLPVQQGAPLVQLRRDLEIVRPSVFLEGNRNEISNAIVSVAGPNLVQVVPLDPEYTRVRMIFPGECRVGFDRLALESSDIKIGMWLSEPQSNAYPECVWGLRRAAIATATERIVLPVTAMSAAGALDERALFVHAESRFGPTQLAVSTDPDFLYLFQRH